MEYDKKIEYNGWAEWLHIEERRVELFNHDVIDQGKAVKLKWDGIVSGTRLDLGRYNCEYCKAFYNPEDEVARCDGCPIKHFTHGPECIATPYFAFRKGNSMADAEKMKKFVDEIFIRTLLLINWREYYEMPSL